MATNAGYIEFKRLTGQVRTGCPNTPAYISLYCNLHKPAMVQPQWCEVSEDADEMKSYSDSNREPVGLITGKSLPEILTSIRYEYFWT